MADIATNSTSARQPSSQDVPADDTPVFVNNTGEDVLLGAEYVLVPTHTIGRLMGQPVPSIPVPHNIFGTIDELSPRQKNTFAAWALGINYFDLIANDMFVDHMVIPDSESTNKDLTPDDEIFGFQIDSSTGKSQVPGLLTFGTLVFVSDLANAGLDYTRDLANVRLMIANNPTSTLLRSLNLVYFSLVPVVNSPEFNTSVNSLRDIKLDRNSWQVMWFELQSGLSGVDPARAAELISSYQDSGDAGAHDAMFAYFRREYGIDLSNVDDPTTALVLGAAQNAARISPSSAMASQYMAAKALALGQAFALNANAAAGAQFTTRAMLEDMKPLAQNLTCAGVAVLSGGMQLGSVGLFSGHKIDPLTYAAIGGEQAIGFVAAAIAEGDEKLLLATMDGASQIGGAFAIPYSLAALSYGTDYEYIINEDGSFSPNPSTSGFYYAILGGTAISDVFSSRRAGKYLRQAVDTGDSRYAAPAIAQGTGVLLSLGVYAFLSTKNTLPKGYVDYYEQLLGEKEDPFTSNNARNAMFVPALITTAVNGAAMAEGYFEAKGKGNKPTFIAQAELEAAGQEYATLVADADADPSAIEAARRRLGNAQVMLEAEKKKALELEGLGKPKASLLDRLSLTPGPEGTQIGAGLNIRFN